MRITGNVEVASCVDANRQNEAAVVRTAMWPSAGEPCCRSLLLCRLVPQEPAEGLPEDNGRETFQHCHCGCAQPAN